MDEDLRMFAQLDADGQRRVLRLCEALASKDPNEAAWAFLVCRIAADATGKARTVALLYVEDGLTWREVAEKTGLSPSYCYTLYKKAMKQVNAA